MKIFFTLLFAVCWVLFAQAQSFTVVADSLRVPNGLESDGNGNIWLVEVGFGFNDGTVSLVKPDGTLLPVIIGLPSVFDTVSGDIVGPWHTLRLPGNQLAVVTGKGTDPYAGSVLIFNLTGFVPGITPPMTAASSTSQITITDFVHQNQPAGMEDSNPYSVATDNAGNMYVVDAGFNGIVKVAAGTGQRAVFATFNLLPNPTPIGPPVIDPVPTRILAKPGGGFYVATLTGFPFLDGLATIYSLDMNGMATAYATGLTMVTDLALDANTGDLYALQFGRFTFDPPPPGFVIGSSQLIRIQPDGAKDTIASDFGPAAGLALDGQGNVYVTSLFDGSLLKMEQVATGTKQQNIAISGLVTSPNPTQGITQVNFHLGRPGETLFRVCDASGRLVFSEYLGTLPAGEHLVRWNPDRQPAGIYFGCIRSGNELVSVRIVKE